MASERRTVLVVGATGKQGTAFIRQLLLSSATAEPTSGWHILALTRNLNGDAAKSLLTEGKNHKGSDRISLVQGNLDKPNTIRQIFSSHTIWGVFVVLAYPGLNALVTDHREREQGKILADLALEFGVKLFMYSSSIPTGPGEEDGLDISRKHKRDVEVYLEKDLGAKGLPWIIIRPGFFYENLEGPFGAMGVTMFRDGLKKETTIAFISSDDIGKVAARLFEKPELYLRRYLCLTSGERTMTEIMEDHKRATGTEMPAIPAALGWLLLRINKGAQKVVKEQETNHAYRASGTLGTFDEEVALTRSVCELQSYEAWKRERLERERKDKEKGVGAKPEAAPGGWNNLSLVKLLTGRS
ncbi:hypothetical protein QBC35DRAFT_506914 [Podospora australis]|uniref:NmrA-like domain-containing protein n=1 Tax=Podospora australis TaxID=1536484 RepID=A0AAN6WL06_9PEZI|nr:hypothetical protein QBC35DRAFT_506914 [Podospora australis]